MTELWNPRAAMPMASPEENRRVRGLYMTEKMRVLVKQGQGGHPAGHKCKACGTFRGDLARDWVAVATKANLKIPGEDARKPLREGETEEYRRMDAARTRIRHFEAGTDQFQWVLVGIETTIADRHGGAYPPAAYHTQGRLDLGLEPRKGVAKR